MTVAVPYITIDRLALAWGITPRRLVDWLRAAGIPIGTAPRTTLQIVRLADLERVFSEAAKPGETSFEVVTRVTGEAMTADDVLRSVGLRRRAS